MFKLCTLAILDFTLAVSFFVASSRLESIGTQNFNTTADTKIKKAIENYKFQTYGPRALKIAWYGSACVCELYCVPDM